MSNSHFTSTLENLKIVRFCHETWRVTCTVVQNIHVRQLSHCGCGFLCLEYQCWHYLVTQHCLFHSFMTWLLSLHSCLKHLGSAHHDLTLTLIPELLGTHPYFDTPEPDMDDPACILSISWKDSLFIAMHGFLKVCGIDQICLKKEVIFFIQHMSVDSIIVVRNYIIRYWCDGANIELGCWMSYYGVPVSWLYSQALFISQRQSTTSCASCQGQTLYLYFQLFTGFDIGRPFCQLLSIDYGKITMLDWTGKIEHVEHGSCVTRD